ncbi:MAG: hypothetical protein JWQ35_1124 [Bacteriovoracaceae bacterium]|nr:hypothetical protein [Bacteriovoracaceae bacterium]
MLLTFILLSTIHVSSATNDTTLTDETDLSNTEVQKNIVYKKETTVDLSGSTVEAENQLPPAFFLSKMQTPKAQGLLSDRLRFSLRNYNDLGF